MFNGEPVLGDKLDILGERYSQELNEEIGDAGVDGAHVGSSKNFKKYGYSERNQNGKIYVPSENKYAWGLCKRVPGGKTLDNQVKFRNIIFIAKARIRQMWNGSVRAKETFFHEFWYARDNYNGTMGYFWKNHTPTQTGAWMEFRAYEFNYMRTGDNYYLKRMIKWATLLK